MHAAPQAVETQRRLEGIVASAMDAIITVDASERIIAFNPAAERMFRLSAEAALGELTSRFLPGGRAAEAVQAFAGGALARRADGETFPVEASVVTTDAGSAALTTVILRDVSERRMNEEARVLLAREVDHRAKNALAVVQALVTLTQADSKEDFVRAVRGRVAALARAHGLLAQSAWRGVELAVILGDELSAVAQPGQAACDGPPVIIEPDAVQPLSLVAHELATNARRHGAVSEPDGRVDVEWRFLLDGSLELAWRETNGPTVAAPARRSFGLTLLEQVVVRQLGGALELDWRAEGLEVEIRLPASLCRRPVLSPDAHRSFAPPPMRPAVRPRRVLIVEDESLVALELSQELAEDGWEVVGPANTLAEALRIAAETPDLGAALLDVNLHGRPVYPLAEALQARGVPFIFCTGYELADPDGRFQGAQVLRKPFDPGAVRLRLDALIAAEPH